MSDQATGTGQDQPLTYFDAEERYRENLTGARERYDELTQRDLSAKSAAMLRERGEFDPDNLGHQLVAEREPLGQAERLEFMATGEVLARYYRHPAMLDHAAAAGADWDQIGAARGTSADQASQDYRDWAEGQHQLWQSDGRWGLNEAEYATALARTGARPAGTEKLWQ